MLVELDSGGIIQFLLLRTNSKSTFSFLFTIGSRTCRPRLRIQHIVLAASDYDDRPGKYRLDPRGGEGRHALRQGRAV